MPKTTRKESTLHLPFPATVKFGIYAALPGFMILSAILLAAFPEATGSLIFYLSLGFSLGVQPLAFYGYKKFIQPRIFKIENIHLNNALILSKGVGMSVVAGLSTTAAGNDNSPANILAAEWAISAAGNSDDPAYVAGLYQDFSLLFLICLSTTAIYFANKAYRPDENNEANGCNNYFNIRCALTPLSDFPEMVKEYFWFFQQCCGGAERQALLDDDHDHTILTAPQSSTDASAATSNGVDIDLSIGGRDRPAATTKTPFSISRFLSECWKGRSGANGVENDGDDHVETTVASQTTDRRDSGSATLEAPSGM